MDRRQPSGEHDAGWGYNTPAAVDVAKRLRELGCDPIAGMAGFAQDDTVPPALRARMLAELATYIAPRRKAVELSGPGGNPIEVRSRFDISALSHDEQKELLALLRKARVGPTE